MSKFAVAVAFFAVIVGQASANPIPIDTIRVSLDEWKMEAVQIGDKLFTYRSGLDNLPVGTTSSVEFQSAQIQAGGIYSMDLAFDPSLQGITIGLAYTVDILDPSLQFIALEVDSQISALGDDFDVVKDYYDGTGGVKGDYLTSLTSVNGDTAATSGKFGQSLWVEVSAVVPTGGLLESFRDGYVQGVPEPGSFVLAGLGTVGMLGMTYVRRRRTCRK